MTDYVQFLHSQPVQPAILDSGSDHRIVGSAVTKGEIDEDGAYHELEQEPIPVSESGVAAENVEEKR
jgi:hypothetical protein